MESDPIELSEHGHLEEYDDIVNTPHDDYEDEYPANTRIPFRTDEIGEQAARRREAEDNKLFKNIVKRYGPGDQRDQNLQRSQRDGSKERSPNRLYSDPKKKFLHQEQQNQAKFSFHPEIGEMPKDLYKESGRKLEISKSEQWDRILRPKTETVLERERRKFEKEAQELQENCSFQPDVNKTYQLSSAKYLTNKTIPITERLYSEGMEKLKTKEMEKRKTEDDTQCTFQPDIAESVAVLKGEKVGQKPLHERLGEIMKQKQEFLQKIKLEAEINNPDLCFKPALNEHSHILAEAKQQVRDVTDRLMKDAAEKVYRKMKQSEEYESQLTSMCTFKPNVNPISRSNDAILATNDMYATQKDMVTRQYLMADIQRENLQKKAAEIIAQEGCTFVPKINRISQFLIEADPQRNNENVNEKMDRLSKKDAQKREIFQEQMQKAHYEQYTFKPAINRISKDIGKRASLDELAYNRDAKEHLRILREKSIDNMLSECSFRPRVNHKQKYESVEPLYKDEEQIMDNIKIHNKKKEIKYDQQRKIGEYDEMKECTFKPKIKGELSETVLKPKLGEKVAGLDKFMQIRDKHKRQQLEKKRREEEVFNIEKKYNAAKHEGFTTPEPFKLSRGNQNSIRDSKVAQDIKEKMAREYTFKPNTNEGKNREIINRVLSNGSRAEN